MHETAAPFVSIIIPTFNGGRRLEETVKSCLIIRGVELEIVLVDDASTDATPERIQQLFPMVKLYHLPGNSGSGSAGRNAGLAVARGRYIKFLDHDDLLQPRGFQAECEEALRSDADMVLSRWGVVRVDSDGRFQQDTLNVLNPPDPALLIEAILLGQITPVTAAVLYKRTYLGRDQWDPQATMIDDFDWFCRQAIKGGRVCSIDSISHFWCLHPGSIQGRSHEDASIYEKLTLSRFRTYQKIEAFLNAEGQLTSQRRPLLARRYYSCLRCLARYDGRQCWELLARIRRLDPTFRVDASCEPDGRSLAWIHAFGLPSFLVGYGLIRRLGDGAQQVKKSFRLLLAFLRQLAVQAPGRG